LVARLEELSVTPEPLRFDVGVDAALRNLLGLLRAGGAGLAEARERSEKHCEPCTTRTGW
jgi:hypothetical protein